MSNKNPVLEAEHRDMLYFIGLPFFWHIENTAVALIVFLGFAERSCVRFRQRLVQTWARQDRCVGTVRWRWHCFVGAGFGRPQNEINMLLLAVLSTRILNTSSSKGPWRVVRSCVWVTDQCDQLGFSNVLSFADQWLHLEF